MPPRVSGKRYAQAIFEIALEQDRLDQWESDLEFVDGVLQDDDFEALLKHADVPIGHKMRAIETVMAEVDPLVRNMISLLVTKGLVNVVQGLRSQPLSLSSPTTKAAARKPARYPAVGPMSLAMPKVPPAKTGNPMAPSKR